MWSHILAQQILLCLGIQCGKCCVPQQEKSPGMQVDVRRCGLYLLVTIRLQVGGILAQAVLEAVLVALVEALAAGLVDEGQQIHLGKQGTAWGSCPGSCTPHRGHKHRAGGSALLSKPFTRENYW